MPDQVRYDVVGIFCRQSNINLGRPETRNREIVTTFNQEIIEELLTAVFWIGNLECDPEKKPGTGRAVR